MSRSAAIRAHDVAQIMDLVGEVYSVRSCHSSQIALFLERMCGLFRAKFCCFAIAPDFCRQRYDLLQLGGSLSAFEMQWLSRYASAEHLADPLLEPFVRHLKTQRTLSQRQLMDRRAWLRSSHFNEYRAVVGIDDCIYSGYEVAPAGYIIGIGIHRALHDRQFSTREQTMIDLTMCGLERLFREVHTPRSEQLPGYLRRLLPPLREGLAAKQIASTLNLSVHSVNTYLKEIFAVYGVTSRAELMVQLLYTKR
ncbi:MAG: hypothetical protein IT450_13750 [Phycisphaerales bacterium]|nr:hypothetical protein [Phycisphaerales bacterium]